MRALRREEGIPDLNQVFQLPTISSVKEIKTHKMENPTDKITCDQCPTYLCKYSTTWITQISLQIWEQTILIKIIWKYNIDCGHLFTIYRNGISLFYSLGLFIMLSCPCLFFAIAIVIMLPQRCSNFSLALPLG